MQSACDTPSFAANTYLWSGVIEAGCKTVVAYRLRSGMFWTVRGANAILALRCCHLNGEFEDYWEARRAGLSSTCKSHTHAQSRLDTIS